jgi:hypothetical protein
MRYPLVRMGAMVVVGPNGLEFGTDFLFYTMIFRASRC